MKNIILCFDGTCNEPEDAAQERKLAGLGELEDSSITNVLKLHLLFGGDLQGNNAFPNQLSFYYSGVGTYGSWFDKIRNMALAPPDEDVGAIIKRAIRDLHRHYENGDRVFIFGFSRGAAIARRLASVMTDTFPALGHAAPQITFMGVFDTVAAIQRPNLFKEDVKPASDVVFENKTISPLIDKALHLVSLDDRRIAFFPALMNRKDGVVEEIWFAGAHANVGGGYRYDGLSDITLQFLLDYMDKLGLGLQTKTPLDIRYDDLFDGPDEYIRYEDIIIQPNHLGKSHEQEAITRLREAMLDYRSPRVSINDKPSIHKPLIHHSVLDRMQDDPGYDPAALRTNMINPYTDESVGIRVLYSDDTVGEYESLAEARQASAATPSRLGVDEQRVFTVHANQRYNATRILANKGDKLVFKVSMDQAWYDAGIECDPAGWQADDDIQNRFKRWAIKFKEDERRHPQANWFEVIGCLNRSDETLLRVLEHTTKKNAYVAPLSGQLYAFANDLLSKYGNNRGSVQVTVTRIK